MLVLDKALKCSNKATYNVNNNVLPNAGFEESEEEALEQTQRCCLCDIDLAYGPIQEEAEDDYEHEEYEYQVFARLPEVAVLACGHAFHEQCLLSDTPEEFSRDPLCFICASLC